MPAAERAALAEVERDPCSLDRSAPVLAGLTWAPPIRIEKGGVYEGNWLSLDPAVPAISIATTEEVTIRNSTVAGRSDLITGHSALLVIDRVRAYGLGGRPGKFISLRSSASLRITNSYLQSLWGMRIFGLGPGIPSGTIAISGNAGCNIREGLENRAHFVQIVDGVFRQAEITGNRILNQPGKSSVEDVINIYNARGLPESPISISRNVIDGAFPPNPAADPFSGGGIIVDGGNAPRTDRTIPAYVRIHDNCVLATVNYGIAIAAGSHNTITKNFVLGSGVLPDGTELRAANVGLYIWNTTQNTAAPFSDNVAFDNFVFWRKAGTASSSGKPTLNHVWTPDCATNDRGAPLCRNNAAPQTFTDTDRALKLEQLARDTHPACQLKVGPDLP